MELVLPPTNPIPIASSFSSTADARRPAVILTGLANYSGDYRKLQLVLEGYGVPSVVVKVSRPDWLRNEVGFLDGNYWSGTLRPRPVLDWYDVLLREMDTDGMPVNRFVLRYLMRADEAVREAKELTQVD